jgi:hypothetical protein
VYFFILFLARGNSNALVSAPAVLTFRKPHARIHQIFSTVASSASAKEMMAIADKFRCPLAKTAAKFAYFGVLQLTNILGSVSLEPQHFCRCHCVLLRIDLHEHLGLHWGGQR